MEGCCSQIMAGYCTQVVAKTGQGGILYSGSC